MDGESLLHQPPSARIAPLLVEIGIAENRGQPCSQIRASFELLGIMKGPQQRLLDEVVGQCAVAGEETRQRVEMGYMLEDLVIET
jgi:hypothetical protein